MNPALYYYANQVYEFSFARLIYGLLGGTFIAKKPNRKYRLQWYFRKKQRVFIANERFLKRPPIIVKDVNGRSFDLPGIIISTSNTEILRNPAICTAIFMGHGTGDKKYGGFAATLETYDYHFISGPKHLQKLIDLNVSIPEEKLIRIGNPRFDELVNGGIDRDRYLDHLGVIDRTRKTILYAPTWEWGAGTLHKYIRPFCRELTGDYNLIIRPHYFDRKYLLKYRTWAKLNGIQHVYFSNPANFLTNDTMYDFAVSDLLISDTSSILYEYLITRNPIIVIDTDFDDLHRMPPDLDIRTIAGRFPGSPEGKIAAAVETALVGHDRAAYSGMLENSFYFNDGRSARRIQDFLASIS